MKKRMNRFALLAALGGILSSVFLIGCGGQEDTSVEPVSKENMIPEAPVAAPTVSNVQAD
ncbi:MAG: hypothetical protein JWN98_1938 [Abditibacteriota bacterium]|jgi:hypothetical protein|nr:hypothetical protein [Abditibacteriota bacterium]